ncbi:MAG: DUF808 family protein, partial [Gammaproteobacteria bacterium]
VSHLPVLTQILVIALISIIMTVGVYGFVAAIVKLDDAGLYLLQRAPTVTWGNGYRFAGQALLSVAPRLMKWLTVVGTIAMFLVGGGIIAHGCHAIIQWTHAITHSAAHIQPLASTLQLILTSTIHVGIGLIVGLLTWLSVQAFLHLFRRLKP